MSEEKEKQSLTSFLKGRTDIKILLLGDSSTGKTSFSNLWINNKFNEETKPTIIPEFSFKMYNYKGNNYKVQMWDLGGQDKSIYTTKVFSKGAHGCLILYDAEIQESFDNTIKWKQAIDENSKFVDGTPIPIILIQNKIDLVDPQNLEKDEEKLKQFVNENGFLSFVRTSCKKRQNVNESMDVLLSVVIDKLEEYYKINNIPLDIVQRNSIVMRNPSVTNESLLGDKKSFCCFQI
jgi:small GTP-binding protein